MSTCFNNETGPMKRHQGPKSVRPSTSEPKAKPMPTMTNTIAMQRIQKRRHIIVK